MATEIITTEDLQVFKDELLDDIKKLLNSKNDPTAKKWLKSYEVRKLLKISPSTLQNLRINGTLPYTKIGGLMYYDYDDIQTLLTTNKSRNSYH